MYSLFTSRIGWKGSVLHSFRILKWSKKDFYSPWWSHCLDQLSWVWLFSIDLGLRKKDNWRSLVNLVLFVNSSLYLIFRYMSTTSLLCDDIILLNSILLLEYILNIIYNTQYHTRSGVLVTQFSMRVTRWPVSLHICGPLIHSLLTPHPNTPQTPLLSTSPNAIRHCNAYKLSRWL